MSEFPAETFAYIGSGIRPADLGREEEVRRRRAASRVSAFRPRPRPPAAQRPRPGGVRLTLVPQFPRPRPAIVNPWPEREPPDSSAPPASSVPEGGGSAPAEPTTPAEPAGSEYVRWVQSSLNQILGLRLPIDGRMSAETRSAVREFQQRQRLPADGIVGPDTERALLAARRRPAPARAGARRAELEMLEAGYGLGELEAEIDRRSREYGRWVQSSLNRILGLGLAVDGIVGPITRSAIRSFQQRQGLVIDGVVGPQTERALIAAGAPQPPGAGTAPPSPIPTPPVRPASVLAANMVQIATQEWERWGRGRMQEAEPRAQPVLKEYWETGVGLPYPGPARAWSAAFISWVARRAGAGSSFRYASAHTTYVAAAKRNRLANNGNPFQAYRVGEIRPQVGDIVCAERKGPDGRWSGVTYDNVDDGQFRASHCDIVVGVGRNHLTVIGGNVSDSVKDKTIPIDANGLIRHRRVFAVIRVGAPAAPARPVTPGAVDVRAMTHEQFIDFVGQHARRAMAQTGVPASVTVAQAIVESGWGKATIGTARNLFGIKGRGPAGSAQAPTKEFIKGKWITVNANFAAYDSFEQSIHEHAQFFVRNRRYAEALRHTGEPDRFAREIHKAGYATAPNYADVLISLMRRYNLYRFDR